MTKLWPALLLLGGCLVGDGSVDDGDQTPTGPSDPSNPNSVKCSAGFKTTGSFSQSEVRPTVQGEVIGGCWPVGTWTFTATVDDTFPALDIDGDGVGDRCGVVPGTSVPTVESSYSFTVTHAEDMDAGGTVESYTYNGSSPNFFAVKVTEGGGGDCEGGMEFTNADRTQWWTLNPTICTSDEIRPNAPEAQKVCKAWGNRQILGSGEFTQYLVPREY
jgi:hypothetical protein